LKKPAKKELLKEFFIFKKVPMYFNQQKQIQRLISAQTQHSFADATIVKSPQVFAITGGKGGVGKTLTTLNLGLSLQSLGLRTLLIDGDFGLANLDVLLGLSPKYTLDDVLSGQCGVKDIILSFNHLKILPAGAGVLKIPQLGRTEKVLLADHMESLAEDIDIVLIDTPAGASAHVQHWLSCSNEAILIVTPEPTSLADSYALMKIMHQTLQESKFKIIANMVQDAQEGLRVYEKLSTVAEEHLGIHVGYLGSLPLDKKLQASVRERVPCLQRYPFCEASVSFRNLARVIIQEHQTDKIKGSLPFFWRRMVGVQESAAYHV